MIKGFLMRHVTKVFLLLSAGSLGAVTVSHTFTAADRRALEYESFGGRTNFEVSYWFQEGFVADYGALGEDLFSAEFRVSGDDRFEIRVPDSPGNYSLVVRWVGGGGAFVGPPSHVDLAPEVRTDGEFPPLCAGPPVTTICQRVRLGAQPGSPNPASHHAFVTYDLLPGESYSFSELSLHSLVPASFDQAYASTDTRFEVTFAASNVEEVVAPKIARRSLVIPEPSVPLLAMTAVLGLGFVRRRS